MWILLAVLSALCLGFYDINKKRALTTLDVVSVLTFSLWIGAAVLMLPLLYSRLCVDIFGWGCVDSLYVPSVSWTTHGFILLKSLLVLSSWVCAYTSVKYLPLSIVSPMQATRPMWTLIGAVSIFGERLGGWQWAGIALALVSIMVMALGERDKGHNTNAITHDSWLPVLALCLSILLGACSGLYDKYMMRHYDHNAVQVWYIVYQAIIMTVIRRVVTKQPLGRSVFRSNVRLLADGRWIAVTMIAVFLILSDYVYFLALTDPQSMIAVVSMIRRGGTIIPFFYGLLVLHEQHARRKVLCLLGILVGLLCLCLGSM